MNNQQKIDINIADLLIHLESPLSVAELGMERRFGPFLDGLANPSARLSLRWEESKSPPAPCGDLIYDPGSIFRIYRAGQVFCADIRYPGLGPAVLRANALWDDLTLTEQRSGRDWASLLNIGAGELVMRMGVLVTDGLVFHASAIDDHGRGLVFVGHSGEGKSTQVGLWSRAADVIAMSDDRVTVRVGPRGPMCYGTPWGGIGLIARNHHAPLSALILLEQTPENEIQRLTPSAAAPSLLARTFLPYWDRALMERAMANLETLLARVPVYRLRCRPEPEVIPLVRSVL